MDKELEEQLRDHITKEDKVQAEILERLAGNSQAILSLVNDIALLKREQQTIKGSVSPISEFFDSMEQVGRFGRAVRAIVGWLVLVVGTLTMVYVVVSDSVQGK